MRREISSNIEKIRMNGGLTQELWIERIFYCNNLYVEFVEKLRDFFFFLFCFLFEDSLNFIFFEPKFLKFFEGNGIIKILIILIVLKNPRKCLLGKTSRMKQHKREEIVHIY